MGGSREEEGEREEELCANFRGQNLETKMSRVRSRSPTAKNDSFGEPQGEQIF